MKIVKALVQIETECASCKKPTIRLGTASIGAGGRIGMPDPLPDDTRCNECLREEHETRERIAARRREMRAWASGKPDKFKRS